jgi:hypothetical protein
MGRDLVGHLRLAEVVRVGWLGSNLKNQEAEQVKYAALLLTCRQ